jgi:hypothetical protein
MSFQGTTRTDPDGRSLAHPVLIADEWRPSVPRDKDGVLAVVGSIGQPGREYPSSPGAVRITARACGTRAPRNL